MSGTISFPCGHDWRAPSGVYEIVLEYFAKHASLHERTRAWANWGRSSNTGYCPFEKITLAEIRELASQVNGIRTHYHTAYGQVAGDIREQVLARLDDLERVMASAIADLADAAPRAAGGKGHSAPAKLTVELPAEHLALGIHLQGCPAAVIACGEREGSGTVIFSLPLARCPLDFSGLVDICGFLALLNTDLDLELSLLPNPSAVQRVTRTGAQPGKVWLADGLGDRLSAAAADSLADIFEGGNPRSLEHFFSHVGQQFLAGSLSLDRLADRASNSIASWLRECLFKMATGVQPFGVAKAVKAMNLLHSRGVWCAPIAEQLNAHLYEGRRSIREAATRCIVERLPHDQALAFLLQAVANGEADNVKVNALDGIGALGTQAQAAEPLLMATLKHARYLPHALSSLYAVTEDIELCRPFVAPALASIQQFDRSGYRLWYVLKGLTGNPVFRKELLRLYPTLGDQAKTALRLALSYSRTRGALAGRPVENPE